MEKVTGKVLPVMVRSTVDSRVDAYYRAVTILYPQGNIAAEVASRAVALLKHGDPELSEVPATGALLGERIVASKGLWRLTGLLPKWPRAKDVTYARLEDFREKLRDWYFAEGGGMFLSRTAQDGLRRVAGHARGDLRRSTPAGPISDEHTDSLRKLQHAPEPARARRGGEDLTGPATG